MKLFEIRKEPSLQKKYADWIRAHWDKSQAQRFKPSQIVIKDDQTCIYGESMHLIASKIEVPLVKIGGFQFQLKAPDDEFIASYDNIPECNNISLSGVNTLKGYKAKSYTLSLIEYDLEKLDAPITVDHFGISNGNLKSVEGIHKLLKCKRIYIGGNEHLTGSLLDLLKIEGLKEIMAGTNKDENSNSGKVKRACQIISKYLGQGLSGIVKAQRELSENDLDDFT